MNQHDTENFSEILTQLTATERMLLSELDGIDLNYCPPSGGWSGGQVLAHLIKTEQYFHPLFSLRRRLAQCPPCWRCSTSSISRFANWRD